jgi:hypothetical protein
MREWTQNACGVCIQNAGSYATAVSALSRDDAVRTLQFQKGENLVFLFFRASGTREHLVQNEASIQSTYLVEIGNIVSSIQVPIGYCNAPNADN